MKKQIVFIMVDSQSTDMLGCYQNPYIKTPYLDALSKEGLTFDAAYTCQPVCGPARSAIFTGLFPHSNGAWTNCVPLYANVKTIGQRLRDHAIQTAYIGKWHLDGGDYFGNGICPDGWDKDYWYDMRCYLEELTPEERYTKRLEQEKPVLDALLVWANETAAKTAPKSALGKALHYLLEQWPYLVRYLEDGRLELSNNRAERSIKPFVMGRKNWLFANTPAGAQSSAVIYSLIERIASWIRTGICFGCYEVLRH